MGGGRPDRLERAQLYIEDGIHGRYEYSEALHSQVWWYKVAHSPWFQSLYTLCVVVNMVGPPRRRSFATRGGARPRRVRRAPQCLAIFERPSSSAKSPEAMIPPYITNTVELFCVAVYASDLALRYRFMSREYFWKNRCVAVLALAAAGGARGSPRAHHVAAGAAGTASASFSSSSWR